MAESGLETDQEIEELADMYSSSSYSPSTEDFDSDSDTTFHNLCRNNSHRKKRPSLQETDEDLIPKYLAEVEEIRGSSDVENQFIKLCKTFLANHLKITPEQRKKVQMLDIYIDACNFDDNSIDNKKQKFSRQELLDIIEANWNGFCEDYGFHPQNDLKLFVFGRGMKGFVSAGQKKKFKLYLSLYFPYHSLSVVHFAFMEFAYSRRNYENFTAEEDQLLMIWCEVEERTSRYFGYSVLPLILQRSPKILELRRNFLLSNTDPLAEFSMIRDKYMRRKGPVRMMHRLNIRKNEYAKRKGMDAKRVPEYVEDILNRQDNEYPDWIMDEQAWEKMVEMDGQSNVKEIKKTYFQELYPSVRATRSTRVRPVRSTQFKRRLIQQIGLLEQPTWETVDWKELGRNCYNVGAVRVYSVIRTLVKKHVPPEKWDDLDAALTIISEHYNRVHKMTPMCEKDLSTTWNSECSKRQKIDAKRVPEYMEDILNRQDNEYPDWIMDEQAWEKMVEIDGQSNVKEIKKTYFQELYPSVRAFKKVRPTQFKRRLIEEISLLEQPTWETVDWKELGKNCFNVGAVRVYSVIRTLVKKHVPPEKWDDLDAALTSIREYYRLHLPLSNSGKKKNVKCLRSGRWKRTYCSKLERSMDDDDADTEESPGFNKKKQRKRKVGIPKLKLDWSSFEKDDERQTTEEKNDLTHNVQEAHNSSNSEQSRVNPSTKKIVRRKLSLPSKPNIQGFTDLLDSLLNISGC